MEHNHMLQDPQFRRTIQCSKYMTLINQKDPYIHDYQIQTLPGNQLTSNWIHTNGLNSPLLVQNDRDGLGLKLPSSSISLSDIADIMGYDYHVKLIDVGAQYEIEGYTLGEYAEYIEQRSKMHKVLNMISLEVSATSFARHIQAPRTVRMMDWIDAYWPSERRARGGDYPRVQKYVLAGMGGSYTDFHVDFGGTSVWYHVLWGQKVFYLIPPSTHNLKAYQKWITSAEQDSIFFPDTIPREQCGRVVISAGDTLFIPGGWIHGVYTPVDSLVIGGNFLLGPCILPQLQVYAVEQNTRVNKKYRFPFFQQMMFYALCSVLQVQQRSKSVIEDQDKSNSDEEEEDPLDIPRVAWQWPYLVKACEEWISRPNSLSESDRIIYTDSARKCGHVVDTGEGSPIGVVDEWWCILMDRTVPPVDDVKFKDHVAKVRSVSVTDWLDESLFTTYPFTPIHQSQSGLKTEKYDDLLCQRPQDFDVETERPKSQQCVDQNKNFRLTLASADANIAQETASGLPEAASSETTLPKLVLKLKQPVPPPAAQTRAGTIKRQRVTPARTRECTSHRGIDGSRPQDLPTTRTRGKRLSLSFLSSAEDIDIEDEVVEETVENTADESVGGEDEAYEDDYADLDDVIEYTDEVHDTDDSSRSDRSGKKTKQSTERRGKKRAKLGRGALLRMKLSK